MQTDHDKVSIFIDETRFHSPNPTTGAALYALVNVQPGMELYREVGGDRADPTIKDGPEAVRLKEDEHFHSGPAKGETIIVNGTPHQWLKHKITYAEVVTLDVPDYPQHPEISYSVTYKRGPDHKPEGILPPGASVKVKEGMVFCVSPTGQS
jgi:Xaa-Pro aminopeptidase